MEIQGPSGLSGPSRTEAQRVAAQETVKSGDAAHVSDRVEISEQARLLEKLSQVPAIRAEKVQELQRLIESGEYETAERISGAIDKLLEEL
jgi:flagellar biosynthesis anti-sigma factor FlgM